MNSVTFLFIFTLVVIVSLYLVYRKKIHIFLFPNNWIYVFMENENEIKVFPINIKKKDSFKYRNGIYYIKKPLKKLLKEKQKELEELRNEI